MGFREGVQLYQTWANQTQRELENKRQAEADERERQRFARDQQTWADQDAQRTAGIELRTRVLGQQGSEADPLVEMGLTPKFSRVAQDGGFGGGFNPYASPSAATVQAPSTYTPTSPQLGLAYDNMRLAGNNPEAISRANLGVTSARVAANAARLSDYVMGASADQLTQLAANASADQTNRYKMAHDPVSGFTTLELDGEKMRFNRADLASVLAAKYRLKNGDPTALNDIAAVNAGLAKRVADELGVFNTVAGVNNKVVYDKGRLANEYQQNQNWLEVNNSKNENAALRARNQALAEFPKEYTQLINQAQADEHEADKALSEAWKVANPELGDKDPGVVHARTRLAEARANRLRALVHTGVITPEMKAQEVLTGAKSMDDLVVRLNGLGGVLGPEFADQVAQVIGTTDLYRQLAAQAKAKAGLKPPSGAVPPPSAATGLRLGALGAPAPAATFSAPRAAPPPWDRSGRLQPTDRFTPQFPAQP